MALAVSAAVASASACRFLLRRTQYTRQSPTSFSRSIARACSGLSRSFLEPGSIVDLIDQDLIVNVGSNVLDPTLEGELQALDQGSVHSPLHARVGVQEVPSAPQ